MKNPRPPKRPSAPTQKAPPAKLVVSRDAALAHKDTIPTAILASTLKFGETEVPCCVLSDGTPLLTTGGILGVFAAVKDGNLERYIARIPGDSSKIPLRSETQFRVPGNNAVATGYKADALVDICNLYVKALAAGTLHPKQVPLAMRALVILSASAKAGITALVWEATGYDKVKGEAALQDKLAAALRSEAGPYKVLFTPEFFGSLARMFNLSLRPDGRKPMVFAAFLAEFFYSWFDDDVYEAVKDRNPRVAELQGERAFLHHQFLTDFARERFEQHQRDVLVLMRSSANLADFRMRFNAVFRGGGLQLSFGDASSRLHPTP